MPKKPKAAPPPVDDLESELGVSSSPEDLKAVEDVVAEAITLSNRIEKGEALLKQLKAELNIVTLTRLPDIMARANTSLHKVARGALEGWKVEIVPLVAGSLPSVTKADDTPEKIAEKKAKRERGLNFVREAGAEGIIKTVMAVTIEKGQDNLISEMKAKAEELGLAYEVDSDIHHMTLKSFVTERLKNGEEVPAEDLGIFLGRTAKLTPPKEK